VCVCAGSDDVLTEVIYSSCHVETTSLLCSSKHGWTVSFLQFLQIYRQQLC